MRIAFGGRVSVRGVIATVDSPWDRSSPSLSAKYLITPADTQRSGGNAAQNESPALGEGAEEANSLKLLLVSSWKLGCTLKFLFFFRSWWTRGSPLSLKWWWEHVQGKQHSQQLCHLLVSLKETNHHWFYRRGFSIIHHRRATAWTFIHETLSDWSANQLWVRWIFVQGKMFIQIYNFF